MKKGRCNFENFIRKASAFFAVFSLSFLTGCSDMVTDYLQDNNILDPDKYAEDKIISKKIEDPDTADSKETDAGGSSNADFSSNEEPVEGTDTDAESDAASDAASSAGADTSADADSGKSVFDPDAINESIDNLITEIENETGRKRNDKEVEGSDSAGQDATSFFSDTYQNNMRAEIGLTDEGIAEIKESQKGMYAFEHLNDEGKTLYAELLTIIQNRSSDIVVSTLDEEILDVVCQFVLADHPELFYMDGYTYTRYTIGGELNKLSFTGNYIYSDEEIAARQTKIDEYVNNCIARIPEGLDTYGKVKYVYEYLISNTEYDFNAPDNQNICSVFIYGKSVCQGYAKATQYLLNKLGIPATLVTGKVNGVGHAWNLVYVDGDYTYVDTTWGDSSYQRTESSGDTGKIPLINYVYLCCTTQDISRTHTIAETLPMPKCDSMKNNYFVRENEYFVSPDMDAVGELFNRRYADGSNNVTIKCGTKEVYDSLFNSLITDQKVFGFLQGANNTVSYTTFDDQYILIIWLY